MKGGPNRLARLENCSITRATVEVHHFSSEVFSFWELK